MKILMINSVCGIKSTGRICTDLATELESRGHIVRIAYGRGDVPERYTHLSHRIGNEFDVNIHGCYARLFDAAGFGSKKKTEDFITWIEEYNPDVIHLHNIHGYYLNIEILFDYLKRAHKRIIWTLHDCWAFTGHCCYFDFANCGKWRKKCGQCPQKHDYPKSILLDRSEWNHEKKQKLFSGVRDMIIVTPSRWLASIAQESFLGQYPVKAIPNWVNLSAFSNTASDVRTRYGINRKYMVLGVASVWDRRKGLDAFIKMEEALGNLYQIVLVGLSKKQIEHLPKSIIGINHTSSVKELAELYSAADVFVNPTHEDNYPATHLEAIACGTPVISFDVGGCKESANLYGTVVRENDIGELTNKIRKIAESEIQFVKPNLEEINIDSFNKYIQLLERGL